MIQKIIKNKGQVFQIHPKSSRPNKFNGLVIMDLKEYEILPSNPSMQRQPYRNAINANSSAFVYGSPKHEKTEKAHRIRTIHAHFASINTRVNRLIHWKETSLIIQNHSKWLQECGDLLRMNEDLVEWSVW